MGLSSICLGGDGTDEKWGLCLLFSMRARGIRVLKELSVPEKGLGCMPWCPAREAETKNMAGMGTPSPNT